MWEERGALCAPFFISVFAHIFTRRLRSSKIRTANQTGLPETVQNQPFARVDQFMSTTSPSSS